MYFQDAHSGSLGICRPYTGYSAPQTLFALGSSQDGSPYARLFGYKFYSSRRVRRHFFMAFFVLFLFSRASFFFLARTTTPFQCLPMFTAVASLCKLDITQRKPPQKDKLAACVHQWPMDSTPLYVVFVCQHTITSKRQPDPTARRTALLFSCM